MILRDPKACELGIDRRGRWYLVPHDLVIAFKEAREEPGAPQIESQFAEYRITKKCSLKVGDETFHYDPAEHELA